MGRNEGRMTSRAKSWMPRSGQRGIGGRTTALIDKGKSPMLQGTEHYTKVDYSQALKSNRMLPAGFLTCLGP
jgi:hypothetical protein